MRALSIATLQTFWGELEKIAEIGVVERARQRHAEKNERALRARLQAGDLIFSAPHRNSPVGGFIGKRIFKPLSRVIQDTDYGHAALYVGGGNIIDARAGRPVIKSPLRDLLSGNDIIAVRLKRSTPEERKRAVAYAKSQIGKQFSLWSLVRAGTPLQGYYQKSDKKEVDKLICSGLVANAYAHRKFAPVSRHYVRPVQILSSRQVSPIAAYEAPQNTGTTDRKEPK